MITLLTLHLGLVVGPRDFELSVPEATARVWLEGRLLPSEIELTAAGRRRTRFSAAP